jgi:carotenoid cleavage dioxygenase
MSFYMQGNFAPVTEEVTAFDLPVDGAIPPRLRGLYVRNGPNQRSGDPGHWFLGDGMVHGVRLEGGRARWFRNRWVRTRALEEGAELVREDGSVDHSVAKANTNVIGHAGRIFALVETSFPTELSTELETVGTCDFGGRLATSMTAHPKLCPDTGELHFFGYRFLPPYLTYHRLDAAGRLVRSEVIDVPGPTMMHDFALAGRWIVFMDLPIVFSLERALERRGFPYQWSDDYGARLGVMPRDGRSADVRWFEIEPCYVFHPFNAYEDGSEVVVDVARYAHLWRGGPDSFEPAFSHRWRIDLEAGRVREEPLDDRPIEFPRVDDRLGGHRHRHGYAVSNVANVGEVPSHLIKYDFASGASEVHDFGAERFPSEGVFVAASDGAGEDEGFVLLFVYDRTRNASDLVILDASAFTRPPVATVRLPQRVPFGFHGNWIPDAV